MYDVCIVGAGAIGSAAAYHLSKLDPTGSYCLIGPGEPESKDINSTRTTYGCHYDEGRITRVISQVEFEPLLALRSTEDILRLEEESKEKIFSEVGIAVFGDENSTAQYQSLKMYSEACDKFCGENNIPLSLLDEEKVKERWPYVKTNKGDAGRYVHDKSGWISIRNQVRACQTVAINNGATYTVDVVKKIEKEKDETYLIRLEGGDLIRSRNVILSTGAFTNFNNLIDRPLDLDLKGHTVMKIELNKADSEAMKLYPSMIYFYHKNEYVYILPPIVYPNSKTYMKIGHSVAPDCYIAKQCDTEQEVKEWYCQDDNDDSREHLMKQFKALFPEVQIMSYELDFCVMSITATERQYVGFHDKNFLVAAGGNGKTAKMAMEIGKMSVMAILAGKWNYDLKEEAFRLVYKK